MRHRQWRMSFNLGGTLTALAVLLAACGGGQVAAPTATAPSGDPARGQTLFTSEAKPPCATCHSIESISTGQIGPELTHIASKAADQIKEPGYSGSATDAAGYIRESILTPNAFIASNCPTGTCFKDIMPQDFGQKLSEQQLADLVAFLLNQQ